MHPVRKRRLIMVGLLVLGIVVAVGLMLMALGKNINLFYSPSQVVAGEVPEGHTFRIGGLVKEGSVLRDKAEEGLEVRFDLTDKVNTVTVQFTGILPDLFREGQGIVATGKLNDQNMFMADQVLAKHDENYMPPEVSEALKSAQDIEVYQNKK